MNTKTNNTGDQSTMKAERKPLKGLKVLRNAGEKGTPSGILQASYGSPLTGSGPC